MPARTPTPISAITSATVTSRPKHNRSPIRRDLAHTPDLTHPPDLECGRCLGEYGADVTVAMTGAVPRLTRGVRSSFHEELDPGQRSALLSWLAFAATRGITYAIRAGKGPFRNLSAGGEHLHHYLWGIGMLTGVGAVAVRGEDVHRRHPAVALSYGAGLALIVDEFALLLDLKDVYWAEQGRISIDLGVGVSAVAGSYFAARPVLRATRPLPRAVGPGSARAASRRDVTGQ